MPLQPRGRILVPVHVRGCKPGQPRVRGRYHVCADRSQSLPRLPEAYVAPFPSASHVQWPCRYVSSCVQQCGQLGSSVMDLVVAHECSFSQQVASCKQMCGVWLTPATSVLSGGLWVCAVSQPVCAVCWDWCWRCSPRCMDRNFLGKSAFSTELGVSRPPLKDGVGLVLGYLATLFVGGMMRVRLR
jgi:hypothetical protein